MIRTPLSLSTGVALDEIIERFLAMKQERAFNQV